jgi:hypothetical protein
MSVSFIRLKNIEFTNHNKEFNCDIEIYYNEEILLFKADFQLSRIFKAVKLKEINPSLYDFLKGTNKQLEILAMRKLKDLNLLQNIK